MSAQEWLDRADAYMDRTGYHPDKDIAGPAVVALRAVLDEHRMRYHRPGSRFGGQGWCYADNEDWPCATVRAITDALGGAS